MAAMHEAWLVPTMTGAWAAEAATMRTIGGMVYFRSERCNTSDQCARILPIRAVPNIFAIGARE